MSADDKDVVESSGGAGGGAGEGAGGGAGGGAGAGGRHVACYFCNESFELGHLQSHLQVCGSILEQCARRCGAWLQRRRRAQHAAQCGGGRPLRTHAAAAAVDHADHANHADYTDHAEYADHADHANYADHANSADPANYANYANHANYADHANHTWTPRAAPLDECVSYLEREIAAIKVSLAQEAGGAARALAARVARLEAAGAAGAAGAAAPLAEPVAALQAAVQELRGGLAAARAALRREARERELLEAALSAQHAGVRAVLQLEEAIVDIQQQLETERRIRVESQARDVAHRCERQDFSAPPSVPEAAAAAAAGRDVRALTKSYLKLRAELNDFQARVALGDGGQLGSDDGRMIWRIDKFAARMKEARESDAVLSSPLFRTSKYGYTLKAELHLNGIGKWRGRHVTATVRLLAGPWDALLRWPCDLGVRVVLRDQPAGGAQAMDIVKSLELRRKSSSKRHDYDAAGASDPAATGDRGDRTGDRSDQNDQPARLLQLKRQHVFFPHASLDKFDYVRDDVMFIEFVVDT